MGEDLGGNNSLMKNVFRPSEGENREPISSSGTQSNPQLEHKNREEKNLKGLFFPNLRACFV